MGKRKCIFYICAVFLLVSCQKSNKDVLSTLSGESGFTYNQSYDRWKELKNVKGNSYTYVITFMSSTGYGNSTELKVLCDTVVERNFEAFHINDTSGVKEVYESFHEGVENIGIHDLGADPFTVDELYNTCANRYLDVDKEKYTLYFNTGCDGIINECGFVANGCEDDCFRGFQLSFFEWIE